MGKKPQLQELHVNTPVPSYFRCPISLDVMKSPVSLCTGVTYDRESIQRWLEQGHNTCPATMQILPSTDLVPNRTLQRLIQIWTAAAAAKAAAAAVAAATDDNAGDDDGGLASALSEDNDKPRRRRRAGSILRELQLPSATVSANSDAGPLPSLRMLSDIASDPQGLQELAENPACIPALNGVLVRQQPLEALEHAVGVLALVISKKGTSVLDNKSVSSPETVAAVVSVLRDSARSDTRANAARVLESIASSSQDDATRLMMAEAEGLLEVLARTVTGEASNESIVEPALGCVVAISTHRRARPLVVRADLVPAAGKVLSQPSSSAPLADKALQVLEAAATCAEGRAAICEDGGTGVLGAVVGRMMRGSREATERAVAILWGVRHVFRDRRVLEAVAARGGCGSNGSGGGLMTKLLLLLQSDCSPAARQMAGDLLRIFRVGSKGCLATYDSKTAHIMPY